MLSLDTVSNFTRLLPRSAAPAEELHLFDVRTERYDEHFAARVLQGIVARTQPRIALNAGVRDAHPSDVYAASDLDDTLWLRRLETRGHRLVSVSSLEDLVDIYRSEIAGAVLYEDTGNSAINIALMLASCTDALPCTPFLARRLNLPVLEDTRERWPNAEHAYRWALEHLRTRCHPALTATSPERYFNMMDYLAEFKVFTCHLPNFHTQDELGVFTDILQSSPAGSPVVGVWDLFYARYSLDPDSDYERDFIDLISRYGSHFLVTHDCGNLSLHSGLPVVRPLPQNPGKAVQTEEGRTYISFLFSEGDNLTFQVRNRPVIWEDPARGSVPLGWSIAPAMFNLFPDAAAYYEDTRSPQDSWIIANSGIGYCMPSLLGKNLSQDEQELAFQRYCDLTNEASEELGIHLIWILDHRPRTGQGRTSEEYVADPETVRRLTHNCPAVRAVFCDYPDLFDNRDFSPKQYVVNGVPVLHARTRSSPGQTLVEQIRDVAREAGAPPFVFVFVSGWSESPSSIQECVKQLGPDFVTLAPADLAATYLEWSRSGAGRALGA